MSFLPERLEITNITNAIPAVVTTSGNHFLTTGQVVRINVPVNYGMYELNKTIAHITVLSANTFSLQSSLVPPPQNISTVGFGTFVIPANPAMTAEVIPIGAGPVPIPTNPPNLQNNVCASLTEDQTINISTVEIPF